MIPEFWCQKKILQQFAIQSAQLKIRKGHSIFCWRRPASHYLYACIDFRLLRSMLRVRSHLSCRSHTHSQFLCRIRPVVQVGGSKAAYLITSTCLQTQAGLCFSLNKSRISIWLFSSSFDDIYRMTEKRIRKYWMFLYQILIFTEVYSKVQEFHGNIYFDFIDLIKWVSK